MKFALRSFAITAAAVLALSTSSFADVIFDYSTTVTPSGPVTGINGNAFELTANSVTGVDGAGGANVTYGNSSITATNPVKDTFSGSYDFTVTFTVGASTKTVDFTGTYSGTIGDHSTNIHFSTPNVSSSSFILGGASFLLSSSSVTPPAVGGGLGSFSILVSATAVPEPTSFALLGMGGAGAFGLFRRMKSRAKA